MKKFLTVVFGIIVGLITYCIVSAIVAFIPMLLWNWLMPTLFGLKTITWLQAWGLTWLSSIFFKGSSTSTSKD